MIDLRKKNYFLLWIILLFAINTCTYHLVDISSGISVVSAYPIAYKANLTNFTVIQPNIPYTGNFTNTTITHNWKIETIDEGQVVYFSLSPDSFSSDDFQVQILDSDAIKYPTILQQTDSPSDFLGSWISPKTDEWIIQVNYTNNIEINSTYSYQILHFIPSSGYSMITANGIENFAASMFRGL